MKTQIVVDIYEGEKVRGGEIRYDQDPVVTHIFHGANLKEAREIEEAHKETDSFYASAIEEGNWDGIPLRYTYDVVRI